MKQITNTKNIRDLREVLYEQIDLVRCNKAEPKTVNTVANVASKIISTVKLEMQYLRMMGKDITKVSIKGMLPESEGGKQIKRKPAGA